MTRPFRGQIDWRHVPGLGRRFRLETSTLRGEHRQRLALANRLLEGGQFDILRALRDGSLSWPDLLDANRNGRLGYLVSELKLQKPLWATVASLFPKGLAVSSTGRRYHISFERLRALNVLHPQATVLDLTRVDWKALARKWETSGSDWNHLRRAVSKLLTLLTHKHHPIWAELRARFPIMEETVHEPVHTVEEIATVVAASPQDVQDALRAWLVLGLRPTEFDRLRPSWLGRYTLKVDGGKNRWATREIAVDPRAWTSVVATVKHRPSEWTLRTELRKSCNTAGVPRLRRDDLRHLTAQRADDAGIPDGVQQRLLGHAPRIITDRYRRARFKPTHATLLYEAWGPVFPADAKVLTLRAAR